MIKVPRHHVDVTNLRSPRHDRNEAMPTILTAEGEHPREEIEDWNKRLAPSWSRWCWGVSMSCRAAVKQTVLGANQSPAV